MYVPGLILCIGVITFSCAIPMMPRKGICKFPPKLQDTELLGDWTNETFPQGHLAHYTCRPGYSRLGAIRRICSEGKWLPISKGECKKKRCGNPGEIESGAFELINGDDFVFGAIVEYYCEPGYQLINKYKTIECTANGWSKIRPQCEARLCPPVVDNSVRVLSTMFDEEYTIGHVIKLECRNPNNELTGPSEIYCTSNGTWNIDPPTCKGPCTVQNDIMKQYNIQVKNYRMLHVAHNEVIEFECIPGYEISDPINLTIKCSEGVITYPKCHLKDEQKVKKKTCPAPPKILFGEFMGEKKEEYRSGSSIQFKCFKYYVLEGKKIVKCQNGVWDHPPSCLLPCILTDNYIKGNNIILVNDKKKYLKHNETVTFKCLQAFSISDPQQLKGKCLNGTLKYPKCVNMGQCTLNENTMLINNITVKSVKHCGSQKKCGIYKKNETVEFACLPGYEISDPEKLKVKCHHGVIEYPICFKITGEMTVEPSEDPETKIY